MIMADLVIVMVTTTAKKGIWNWENVEGVGVLEWILEGLELKEVIMEEVVEWKKRKFLVRRWK